MLVMVEGNNRNVNGDGGKQMIAEKEKMKGERGLWNGHGERENE